MSPREMAKISTNIKCLLGALMVIPNLPLSNSQDGPHREWMNADLTSSISDCSCCVKGGTIVKVY